MRIKEKISQHRRDFTAVYQCEHCKDEFKRGGYDDYNFYQEVIPEWECKKCGKKSDRRPGKLEIDLEYPEDLTI